MNEEFLQQRVFYKTLSEGYNLQPFHQTKSRNPLYLGKGTGNVSWMIVFLREKTKGRWKPSLKNYECGSELAPWEDVIRRDWSVKRLHHGLNFRLELYQHTLPVLARSLVKETSNIDTIVSNESSSLTWFL